MSEFAVFRVLSLAVVMVVVGLVWFKVGTGRLKKEGVDESQARSRAKKQAVKYSIILGAFYMVLTLTGIFS